MERLLVTSIDTTVGSNLALALSDRCEVLALYDRCPLETPSLGTACWQAGDTAAIDRYVEAWQPQWIVHGGPLSASSWDPAPGALEAQREVRIVTHLADLAERWGARLTVLSSDAVFSGPRMFHEETSPTASTAPRAAHVLSMERALEKREALVVRTHAYGWSFDPEAWGFAETAFEALARRAKTVLGADGRRHATPILATDLAELLWRAYETRLHGLYHLAGAERTSPCRFVAELAGVLGVAVPDDVHDHPLHASSWHEETSLSSRGARRMLAVATPMLRDGLQRFAEQAQNGWRSKWRRVVPSDVHAVAA